MASIKRVTDLKINGSDSYTGPGPVVITWSPVQYSGNFAYMWPRSSLVVHDGTSWGEGSGPPNAGSIDTTSYTFTEFAIQHVKDSGNTAEIQLTCGGYDVDGTWIQEDSNVVTYTYADTEPSEHNTIKCYLEGGWTECVIYYFDGSDWIECTPYYYDGTEWTICSF